MINFTGYFEITFFGYFFCYDYAKMLTRILIEIFLKITRFTSFKDY